VAGVFFGGEGGGMDGGGRGGWFIEGGGAH
jgi:hypothetical protein